MLRLESSAFDRYVEGYGINWPHFKDWCHELSLKVSICHLPRAQSDLIIAFAGTHGNAFARLKDVCFNAFTFCLRFALRSGGDEPTTAHANRLRHFPED